MTCAPRPRPRAACALPASSPDLQRARGWARSSRLEGTVKKFEQQSEGVKSNIAAMQKAAAAK